MSSVGSNRTDLVSTVAATLGVGETTAERIVVAFELFVAEPLEKNLEEQQHLPEVAATSA